MNELPYATTGDRAADAPTPPAPHAPATPTPHAPATPAAAEGAPASAHSRAKLGGDSAGAVGPAARAGRRSLFARLAAPVKPGWLILAVCLLGLVLRVEHALTFDGPGRGSDYAVYMQGIRWMLEHHRPFNFDPTVNYQVRYQPPLWYAAGAVVLWLTQSERAIAALSVAGWCVRQWLLARLLREAAPKRPWSALAALSIHAVLPLSVLVDGKVMPEGPHATVFVAAVYVLWRAERQMRSPGGVRLGTAALFGLLAGLGVLTKATSSVLMIAAGALFAWRVASALRGESVKAVWRRLARPGLVSGLVFCLVVGWYCGPNVAKYGHPFPHVWDREGPGRHAILAQPTLYRRPLGWALPFEWGDYLRFPIIGGSNTPNPNFWAYTVVGTWTDLYNRGFCRLQGGQMTDQVWGGQGGVMASGPQWSVTMRCVRHFSRLAYVGLGVSAAAAFAVWQAARTHWRTRYREGSFVLPLSVALVVGFLFLFSLKYPFDNSAVLNPRYLMPATTPMAACFGLWLAGLRSRPWADRLAHAAAFVGIGLVTALLFVERFGH